jgi:hypothetical protein
VPDKIGASSRYLGQQPRLGFLGPQTRCFGFGDMDLKVCLGAPRALAAARPSGMAADYARRSCQLLIVGKDQAILRAGLHVTRFPQRARP